MISHLTLAKVDSIRAILHFRRSSDVGVSLFSFSSPKSNSLKPESGIEYGVSGISESSFEGIKEPLTPEDLSEEGNIQVTKTISFVRFLSHDPESLSETDTFLLRIDKIISLNADLFGDISELVDFSTFFSLSFPFILYYSVIERRISPVWDPVRSFADYQVQVVYQTVAYSF